MIEEFHFYPLGPEKGGGVAMWARTDTLREMASDNIARFSSDDGPDKYRCPTFSIEYAKSIKSSLEEAIAVAEKELNR